MNKASFKKIFEKWMVGFGLWLLFVLLFSTRTATFNYSGFWFDMLRITGGHSIIWLVIVPAIIALDRRLPVPRDAFLQRLLYHIPLCLLLITLVIYGRAGIESLLGISSNRLDLLHLLGPLQKAIDLGVFQKDIIIYWVVIGLYVANDYSHLLKDREIRLSKARLDTLRSQIRPHFLFNVLNSISAHIDSDPRMARQMLEQIGELLRFSLDYSDEQKVPLAAEMAIIERYLALQKGRYKKRLEVNIAMDNETLHALVPPLILEPLVENAIVHGVATHFQKGVVEIQSKKKQDRLCISVKDDGPGLPAGWNFEQSIGIGVGIKNTRERLSCLYKENNFFFNITNVEGGGVLAEIEVPFDSANA